MVNWGRRSLSIARQCVQLSMNSPSLYYRPKAASEEDLPLMGEIDRRYLEAPLYGSRRMKPWLERRVRSAGIGCNG